MKTPLLIDIFDFFGKDIPLQIFGATKKKSLFGAIMGLLSLGSIGVISIFFVITLFSRDTKQIITSKTNSIIPSNNMTNSFFLATFADALGKFVLPGDGIWSVYAAFQEFMWKDGALIKVVTTKLELRPCQEEDMGGLSIPASTRANFICVPGNRYNLTMHSYQADVRNGWSQLYFYMTKCNPKTNPNCKNSTVINKTIEKGTFNVAMMSAMVNNDDIDNPGKYIQQTNTVVTSTSLFKQVSVQYAQNLYTDDYGFVFESLVTHNFYTLESSETSYSLGSPSGFSSIVGDDELVVMVTILNAKYVTVTKRTFLKAQAILANIGGVMKFIMAIAQVITQFVVRKSVFIQIGNEVFDYNEKKIKPPREKKKQTERKFLEIEGKTEVVVPVVESSPADDGKMNSPVETKKIKIRNFGTSKKKSNGRVSLKLSLSQLLCLSFCIKDKKVVRHYDLTQNTIISKVSIHSIIRDSFKLNTLSKITLAPQEYKKLNETTHTSIGELN